MTISTNTYAVPIPKSNTGRGPFTKVAFRPPLRTSGWIAVILLLVSWELSVRLGFIALPSVPALSKVATTWWLEASSGRLISELGSTLGLMAVGYGLAAIIGIVIGLAMGSSKVIWELLEPFVELLRPLPISALVPLLILFLGIDAALKVTAVTLGAVFPILVNTYAGVRSVTPTLRETAKTFELSRWRTLIAVVFPHASPYIFVGLRTSLAISLIISVFAEMIAGSAGMGFFILQAQQTLSVQKLYAGVLTLAVVGYVLNALFLRLENLVLPWRVDGPLRRA
ncbi:MULTISPECIES: ABC transporter permease [Agrobacterium]|uniref:ABC transporter permease n=2 Tax=Agrobacterium tumefaciens TaxID=358 RepID=A0AAE6EI84_AGRTU|nr:MULTISPECIES: ABC transporter permease [Agrobacterium]QCL77341.1 ABC transporter permease [Agrobacterium tumefaciens]QCL82848.1 ABC transporter permease [Agrobacterium tumefaciens]WCK05840.1 ABC transporter permease [Agrobacterium tumefaciens]CUX71794.1 ABC-type nitrate/sulfonate/bicarbonate transport system, permease component [Agrobacterium sp. NCPPB 925]